MLVHTHRDVLVVSQELLLERHDLVLEQSRPHDRGRRGGDGLAQVEPRHGAADVLRHGRHRDPQSPARCESLFNLLKRPRGEEPRGVRVDGVGHLERHGVQQGPPEGVEKVAGGSD